MTTKLNRKCQFCNDPATWDAKHRSGPWAYFCNVHFKLLAHPGFAGAATKLEPEAEEIEIFPPSDDAAYGSIKYFELAIEAGYFGCDDNQEFAFRPKVVKV